MATHAAIQEKRVANQATRETIRPDATYLFACHLQWDKYGDLKAYEVLISALDSSDEQTRAAAESLLRRKSPRPKSCLPSTPTARTDRQEH
jgi:hypothetical protein